jgi:hypothetical protein
MPSCWAVVTSRPPAVSSTVPSSPAPTGATARNLSPDELADNPCLYQAVPLLRELQRETRIVDSIPKRVPWRGCNFASLQPSGGFFGVWVAR